MSLVRHRKKDKRIIVILSRLSEIQNTFPKSRSKKTEVYDLLSRKHRNFYNLEVTGFGSCPTLRGSSPVLYLHKLGRPNLQSEKKKKTRLHTLILQK